MRDSRRANLSVRSVFAGLVHHEGHEGHEGSENHPLQTVFEAFDVEVASKAQPITRFDNASNCIPTSPGCIQAAGD